MKKLTGIAALLLMVSAFAMPALAIDNEANPGTTIPLTDGLTPANTLNLNFSPSVNGQYLTDADDAAGNKQWFAIATYHSGGTNFYGTSAEQTVVYKKPRETTETFTAAALVNAKEAPEVATDGVVAEWTGWTK